MFGAVPPPSPQNPHVPEPKPERKRREGEAKKIYEHRLEMFRALGFNELQAEALAESRADWHEVEDLLMAGCPPDVALDISI